MRFAMTIMTVGGVMDKKIKQEEGPASQFFRSGQEIGYLGSRNQIYLSALVS